ncbi:MAG: hypothetical protein K2F61_00140 [Muribaculaceae bacterium]|nr:hypothetical protein [Muribaculaceae bacterium]
MITTYTKAQLMAQWRLRRGLEPMRGDLTVELDGVDTGALDEAELNDWWADMTANAPADMFEPKDLALRCTTKAVAGGGTDVELPASTGCRQVLAVRLSGWTRDGTIVAPDSREADLQRWEYTQAGLESPVAVMYSPRHVRCFPAGEDVESFRAITEGDGEVFTMDSSLLATMGEWRDEPE